MITVRKIVHWPLAVLAMLPGKLAGAPTPSDVRRDWERHPAVVEMETTADIFVVGDVHGDYERLAKLLAGAKIIDGVPASPERAHWIAGRAILVFAGDFIDKGPNALAVIALVLSLQETSAQAGGRVIALMGNHEAEFLSSPNSPKSKDFTAELARAGLDGKDVAAGRGDVGRLLCSMPFAARVNDWFFSHAGNTGGRTIEELARDLEIGVEQDGYGSQQLAGANSLLEARLGQKGPGGKPWFDAETSRRSAQQLLAGNVAALKVKHLVQGHQHDEVRFPDGVRRKAGQMFQRYGLIFLIDTGMSRDIGDSAGAILHIQTGSVQRAFAICANGNTTILWDDKRNPMTGWAAPCRP